MKKVLLIIFLLACITPAYTQKARLRLDLETGKSYRLKISNSRTTTKTLNDNPETTFAVDAQELIFQVTGKKRGVFEMNVKFVNFTMLSFSDNGTGFAGTSVVEKGSEDKDNPMSKLFRAIVNKPFQVKINQLGEVIEVKNYKAVWDHAVQNYVKERESAIEVLALKVSLADMVSDESFKQELEGIFSFYQEDAVEVGTRWSGNLKMGTDFFQYHAPIQFNVTDITDKAIMIDGDGLVVIRDKKLELMKDMPITINMTGSTTVNMTIDKITGWIALAEQKTKMKGTMKVADTNVPVEIVTEGSVNKKEEKKK